MIKECEICKKEFETKKAKLVCSDECLNKKTLEKRVKHKSECKIGEENIDYIICKWCGLKVGRIYGMHIKHNHPGKTLDDYRTEFPNSPIYTDKDIKNVTKSSGLHMKTEKYKNMFSEMMIGAKNPNHTSKTTNQYRKEISPYSIEFYKRKYSELSLDEQNIKLQEFYNKQNNSKLRPTQLQYWLNKGYSESESKEKLKERQTTFTLEKCKSKYGQEEGIKKYYDRQLRWLKNYKKSNFSKISQELFWKIYDKLDDNIKTNKIYFATIFNGIKTIDGKNNEYRLKLEKTGRIIMPDFFIEEMKLIIEFDGIYWHFKRNTVENKKRNELRNKNIIDSGYNILNINEMDYKTDPDKEIQRCLDFIKKYTL